MVGVKTWTDDEIWFVLNASEITKPNTSSTHKNPKPIRYFTDKEIANLCKKHVPNLRHTPDANGVKYIRSNKKAQYCLSPSAPRPSQAVLAAIARLRHECNTSSQHQDGTSENMFSTPPVRSRGKLPQVQDFRGFAYITPALGPNRAGQIVPEQFQTMNAMNPPSLAVSHQMMEIGGFHRCTNTFGNKQINHDLFFPPYNMEPQDFDRPYQQYVINGDIAIPDSGRQQQHGQAPREATLPIYFPIGSCAREHAQLEQTMSYGQQMGIPMQNGNGIPRILQQIYPSSMYQVQGNQMGSDTSTFEPQMQAYNYGMPTQSPYQTNYRGYTPGLQNLDRNEMMIPPGPTDVGRFTNPHGTPSDGQINGGIMSLGGQCNGKDQHLAQQQAGVQFGSLSSGANLDAMPDPQFKPPTSHGLPQTTITNPDFTTSHGLGQATVNTPGSTNDPAEYLGNPEMPNNFETQGDAAAQVEAIRPQPQPSTGNEKRHKRKVGEAGLSDMNPYEGGERKNKRHNGEGSSRSGLSKHNSHIELSGQISIAHTLARIRGLHNAAQAATPSICPVFPVLC